MDRPGLAVPAHGMRDMSIWSSFRPTKHGQDSAEIANRLSAPASPPTTPNTPALKSTKVTPPGGEVQGKSCLIVDDMISTAGSVVAPWTSCVDHGAKPEIFVFVHARPVSAKRLQGCRWPEIVDVMVKNSLPIVEDVASAGYEGQRS